MAKAASLPWSDRFSVGDRSMDSTHLEFLGLLAAAESAEDACFPSCLAQLHRHTEQHFAEEDRQMQASGFPSAQCHLAEHAAVLASVRGVLELVRQGQTAKGRDLCRALANWFPEHTQAMDMGVATWLLKQRTGGAPLTFVRNAAAATAGDGQTTGRAVRSQ